MEQSVTRVSGTGKVARVLVVALLSIVGLTVIGVGSAGAAAAPTVKSLTPARGGTSGGTSVVIVGTAFGASAANVSVTFGGVPAKSFVLNSATQVTAVSPALPAGSAPAVTVVVTVSGTASTLATVGNNIFNYIPSVLGVGLVPATSTGTTGTITITAAGSWTAGQQVTIAGFANGLTPGVYPIVAGGSGSFTVAFPGSTTGAGAGSVSPTLNGALGSVSGGTSVIINGTGFAGATAVKFGTTAATSFTVNSGTQITAVAPAGSGGVDITVTVPTTPTASTSVVIPANDSFNYVTTPTVTGLTTTASTAGGPTGGGTQVTISGSSFDNVTAVDFGATPASSFLLNGLNSITAVAPAGSGTVDVTVTTGRGTSAPGSADKYAYRSTLAVAPGTAAYANSPGTSVPVTGTSQVSTTLTIDAIGTWVAGQKVGLTGFTNGITPGTYTVLAAVTGGFTVTFSGTTTPGGTGSAIVLATATPTSVTKTTTGTGTITLTAVGTWYVGQRVFLTGFTNGVPNGDHDVTAGGSGSFAISVTGNVTATGTGSAIPFQAQSFDVSTLVTGGGTINPASVTVTSPPASGAVTVEGTQLVYIPAQSDPTSYLEGGTTVWLTHVTSTGSQSVTFSICNSSPDTSCATNTVTYNPGHSGLYVGNQLNAIGLLVSVVQDTGGGVVAPPTASSGSTFTTITSPTPTDLPSTDVLPVIGIGGYRSISPVPSGVTLVPGSLGVTGGDVATTGRYTATLCTQAMGFVPNVCTANFFGNFKSTYPYIETSLNAGTLIPGGTQLSLPSVSATWTVTASSGTISAFQTEFNVSTEVQSIGFLALDAFPSTLGSFLVQGLGAPAPVYADPPPRWSVNVAAATAPAAPTAVTATGGNASASVSWTAPVDDGGSAVTGYTVSSTPSSAGCTATAPATTCTVNGLTNGTPYTFTVTATNGVGTGPASTASAAVTPATVPDAPTSVTATPGNASASVSWTAPASNGGSAVTGYTVSSTPSSGGCTAIAPATTCTVNGLTNGTPYTFTVTATNAKGPSAASGASTPVTPIAGAPSSPTGVTATSGNASATVSWTVPASDGGSAITGYTVSSIPSSAGCTSTPPTTSCTVNGLTNGTSYTFTVTATNVSGTSLPSNPSTAVTPATVPGAPTAVSATAGNATATVSWTAPASNGGSAITGYTATSSPGGLTCTSSTTSCTVPGLTNGTPYTFTVTATNAKGTGAASTASTAVTPQGVAPSAPTGVTASAGNASATVSWTPGSTGGSPILDYTVSSTPSSVGCTATATSCTVHGLTNGTPYTFQVTATNAVGTSPLSGSSSPVTPSPNGPIKGYWMATSDGGLLTNGSAVYYGSPAGIPPAAPIVGFAPTPDRHGYWFVGADGGVFNYGDAGFFGSTGGQHLNAPIVGIASTSDGKGYWLVAADGGVFAYGDAAFTGSMGGKPLNAPIVGVAGNGTGGYLLVAGDGGIFAFGSATFHGSAGGLHLVAPIVGISALADGSGYYLAAADGGVFAYNVPFKGSASGVTNQPIIGIAAGAAGGYVLTGNAGAVFAYPSSNFYGAQFVSGSVPVVAVAS